MQKHITLFNQTRIYMTTQQWEEEKLDPDTNDPTHFPADGNDLLTF